MIKRVTVKPDRLTGREDVVILPVFSKTLSLHGAARTLDRSCRSLISQYLKQKRFKAEEGETLLIGMGFPKSPSHVLLLGLGDRPGLDAERSADIGGAASKALSGAKFTSASFLIGDLLPEEDLVRFVRLFVKGFALAQYQFSLNKKPPKPISLSRLAILTGVDRRPVTAAAKRGLLVAEYAARTRDMVNSPANLLAPAELARRARATAKEHGLSCRILGLTQIEKEKMGAILGVSQGSRQEPRLVVMEYNKSREELPQVCLVGKGVTFDSGGISLKQWNGMHEMKGDMAGAAVVINAIAAAARLELPLRVAAVVPAVENMPDGTALRPGDVVTTYSGETVEVLTTDAEGRLILADALTFVKKQFDPAVTIDFATLTGAVLIALGTRFAGVMGNTQDNIDRLVAAGTSAGEPVWQLPLDDRFYEMVKGDISDYKNYSGRDASSITAAALLGKFAGKEPWIHVDIAGTFWNSGRGASYHSKGATGYGVDLALQFMEDFSSSL
ncbi:MAG: leucyl aminopeptidase [Candidatus Latescibacterota bacterium]|jgi:leucyl aminopeptidase